MAAGILKTALLARILGVQGYGTYGLILSFTGMLGLIFGFTSGEAAITYVNRALESGNRQEAAEIIRYCLIFDLFLSLFTYLFLVVTSNTFPALFKLNPAAKTALLVYGISIVGNATHWVALGLLHLFDCFKYDFFYNVARSWFSLGCFAVVYLFKGNLLAVMAMESVIAWIFSVLLLFLTFRVLHSHGVYLNMCQKACWQVSAEIWRYQLWGYLRGSVKGINRHLAILVLGYFGNPTQAGIFNAAKSLTDPLRNGAGIFVHSLYPRYGKLWFSNQIIELKRLFNRSALLFVTLSTGIFLIFWPFLPKILQLLYGEAFIPATSPAMILLFAASILIFTAPLNALLPAIGKNRPPLFAALFMMFIQIALLLVLVPMKGPSGAAWAFVLTLVAGNLMLMPQTLWALQIRGTIVEPCPENSAPKHL